MVKKPDQDQEQEQEQEFEFESEFDVSKIKESAEMDIKPKFEIEGLGLDYAKDVIVKGTYYDVKIPVAKAISNKTIIKAINLIHNGIEHQFFCESESFKYQIDVIRFRRKLNVNQIDGLKIKIWKQLTQIDTPNFKGKAIVYSLKEL